MNTENIINNDAFELIVDNMKETTVNNRKVFARYMLGEPVDEFSKKLLDAWAVADGDCQQRLATSFPQLGIGMLEWQTLPEKKREKYLKNLLN